MKSEQENQSRQFEKALGCPQKVYIVYEGEYDDIATHGVFSSEELAEKYVKKMKAINNPHNRNFAVSGTTVDAREDVLRATEFWYWVQMDANGEVQNHPNPNPYAEKCPYGDFERFQKSGYYFYKRPTRPKLELLITYIRANTYDHMLEKAAALHKQILTEGTWGIDEKDLKKDCE